MSPERLQKVERIYHAVLEVQSDKRADLIEDLCGDDIELRQEVDSLLKFEKTFDNLIDSPPSSLISKVFSQPEKDTHLINQKIGHYYIKKLLGKGGMGEVYLAEDTRLNRQVALKFIFDNLSQDRTRLLRFEREAFAASALNHPNILTIYEFSSEKEISFLATEFVEGETLRDVLNHRKLNLKEILNIAEQIASALALAHKAGIVHRDIKPENVMLREDGLVKVLDFGLAKLTEISVEEINQVEEHSKPISSVSNKPQKLAKKTQFTTSGILLGTVIYMSPEQTRGRNIDQRSDIWSLGVVLYEMLTGKTPFAGDTSNETIRAILKGDYEPLKHFLPNIPPELEQIVEKSICVSLKDRYQKIDELSLDLRNLKDEWDFQSKLEKVKSPFNTNGETLHNTDQVDVQRTGDSKEKKSEENKYKTTSSAEYFVESIKQNKYKSVGGLFILTLLFISGFVYLQYFNDYFQTKFLNTATQPISQMRIQTDGDVLETAISLDGKLLLYTETNNKKYSLRIRQLADNTTWTVITDSDSVIYDPTFSPDGNSIFYLDHSNPNLSGYSLFKVAAQGGSSEKLIEDIDSIVNFSPDGNEIAFRRNIPQKDESYIIIAKTNGADERVLAVRPNNDQGFVNNPVWSPDGKTIVTMALEKTNDSKPYLLFAINVEDGSINRIGSEHWRSTLDLQWLPGGKEILVNATDKPGGFTQFWRVAYPDGTVIKVTDDFNKYQGVSLNTDGTLLATILTRRKVELYVAPFNKLSEAKKIRSIDGAAYYGYDWTPDEKIVFSTNAGGNRDLWMMEADGSNAHQLTNDNFVNSAPVVTPDGRYIVYVSEKAGKSNIWRMNIDGSNPVRLTNGDNDLTPAVTPDSRWVLYQNTSIQKISIDGGEPTQITSRNIGMVQISPDGKFISVKYLTDQKLTKYRLAILPITGGEPVKIFDRSLESWVWVGDSIIYPDYQGENVNLFSRSIKTDQITQLTDFVNDKIQGIVFSKDGKKVILIRGSVTNEAIIIKNFR
ncbi:MAG: serine/threonine-protein kinase [Pyrinomonadaceae bacterium]|nr:serine/threonine-protein kinase [Pyrinomonadaceae bacterium]